MNSTFWTHINALFNSYNKFGERRSFHGKSEIAYPHPLLPQKTKDTHIIIHVCIHIHRYINAWIVHNCFAWSGGGGLAAYCCAKEKRKGTAFFPAEMEMPLFPWWNDACKGLLVYAHTREESERHKEHFAIKLSFGLLTRKWMDKSKRTNLKRYSKTACFMQELCLEQKAEQERGVLFLWKSRTDKRDSGRNVASLFSSLFTHPISLALSSSPWVIVVDPFFGSTHNNHIINNMERCFHFKGSMQCRQICV